MQQVLQDLQAQLVQPDLRDQQVLLVKLEPLVLLDQLVVLVRLVQLA